MAEAYTMGGVEWWEKENYELLWDNSHSHWEMRAPTVKAV